MCIRDRIFTCYLDGASLQQLSIMAEKTGLKFRENASSWNKNMAVSYTHLDVYKRQDFLHNAVWSHPDADHGEEEVAAYINRLREKLKLDQPDSACQIVDEATQRGNGYRLTYSAK